MTAVDLVLSFSLTNEDRGVRFSEWEEPLDDHFVDDEGKLEAGALYRALQREYGRCQSSVYIDRANGETERVGWFFVSRQRYEDTGEPYLRGAWVTVLERPRARYLSLGVA